jgi:type II secretory pathway pseudopilin PulG
MFTQQRVHQLTTLAIILLLALSQAAYGVQDQTDEQKQQEKAAKKQEKEAKKQQEKAAKEQQKNEAKKDDQAEAKKDDKKAMPEGTPVLWKDPGDISARDLFLGPGGEAMKPDLSSVTFIEQQTGGWSPKYRVRDGSGKIWVAKFGSEAQPETVSMRLVWAMGYVTEINYLFPCVHIKGAPTPQKKTGRCEGDGFANVRFEARPEGVKRLTEWEWSNNPFVGTRELKGLIILMGLLNNWDLKTPNNKIIQVKDETTGQTELQYIISDLGATFGKTGGFISHNRNEPDDYAKTRFVKEVSGNTVKFAYSGKSGSLFNNITVEDAKWIGEMLSRLTDKQLNDAFRAANYDQADIALLTGAVRKKINELVNIQGGSAASTR